MPVADAILDSIHAAGYSIGTCCVWTVKGLRYVVTARDAKTDERWSDMAIREYDAACELAVRVGFDLEG